MRAGVVGAVLMAALLAGCSSGSKQPPFTGEPYLVVWAGDADRKNTDFLAVIDADPRSATYGKVLKTYPVQSRGNEPQGLNAIPRADRRLFATGVLSNRTYVFDLRQPLAGRVMKADDARDRQLWAPHEVATLPNGHVVVTAADRARYRGEAREVLATPGGLVELDADGQFVREVSALPVGQGFIAAPWGAAVAPKLGRIVTTSRGHGFAATTRNPVAPGITVQVWRLNDLGLEKTAVLEAGKRGEENLGPQVPRLARKEPFVFVNTHEGGALYASDSIEQPEPAFRLVFDFGAGALPGGAGLTPDDRFYVTALTGRNKLAALDVSDPWHPKVASALGFEEEPGGSGHRRTGGPSAVTLSADGTRVAVADYTIDVPGYALGGDCRVYVVRLDPATGALRFDTAFRDEVTGEVGVDFGRSSWPHGETGPARPAAVLFVTPEPPPSKS